MINTKVIRKYWDLLPYEENAFDKLTEYLSSKQMASWREVIDILREPREIYNSLRGSYMYLITRLEINPFFEKYASFAEKRELYELLYGKTINDGMEVKPSKEFLYREDTTRIETEHGRYYLLKDGTRMHWPGVTSIWSAIKPFDPQVWINSIRRKNPDWREDEIAQFMENTRNTAAARGTAMHEAIEKYLENRALFNFDEGIDEIGKPYFYNILHFLRYQIDSVIAIEPLVYWDMSDICGENAGALGYVDLVATHNGKIVLYDWKTADKPKYEQYIENYKVQVSAYAAMFYQTYGIKVDEVRICVAIKNAKKPQIFSLTRPEMKRHLNTFIINVEKYNRLMENFDE